MFEMYAEAVNYIDPQIEGKALGYLAGKRGAASRGWGDDLPYNERLLQCTRTRR